MKGGSLFFFFAPTPTSALHSMWDLSSLTHGSKLHPQQWRAESYPLGLQGSPTRQVLNTSSQLLPGTQGCCKQPQRPGDPGSSQ